MEAFIGQEGLTEEVTPDNHIAVGKKGSRYRVTQENSRAQQSSTGVYKAWNLLLEKITHMASVTDTDGGGRKPSRTWNIFKR